MTYYVELYPKINNPVQIYFPFHSTIIHYESVKMQIALNFVSIIGVDFNKSQSCMVVLVNYY